MVELAVRAPVPATTPVPGVARRIDSSALSAWTLAFALVTYLSLRGGGYDVIVRSEAGVAVWWIVLLTALAGILPTRFGLRGWVAIALLAGFALWTGLAVGWSESAEQSVIELGRMAAYLGVLVLAIALQGHTAARHTINGLASAIGLVTVLAVLSRLHPQAFPANPDFQFLGPVSGRKLSYPLGYWNALADFSAMGFPLLLAVTVGGRTLAGRALAAATLPLVPVCVDLTLSRGGAIALGVGLVVFLVLTPRRLEALATIAVTAVAAAILLRATSERSALTTGLPTHAAIAQGTSLLWIALTVCLGVALLQVAISLAAEHLNRPALLAPDRRGTAIGAAAVVVVLIVLAVAANAPAKLSHAWHDFQQPSGVVTPGNENSIFTRLEAANGNSRYQFWQSAVHAAETHPWRGIGPGTFQFWWAQHATAPGFIRNAHSLYFETLAETGVIGLALLGGLLLWFIAVAVHRALTESPRLRLWLAGATAGLAVFMFSAAVEWVWQLAAIAAAALILGAVIVAGRDEPAEESPARARRAPVRPLLVVLAAVALGAVLVPFAGQLAIRRSQAAAARGDLATALADSHAAERLQPYAASAHLQEALVLEAAGRLGPAAAAARVATTDSPTDWTTWLTLARIDARRGATTAALAELRRARTLNYRSSLFATPP
jgi:O-antigen ligase